MCDGMAILYSDSADSIVAIIKYNISSIMHWDSCVHTFIYIMLLFVVRHQMDVHVGDQGIYILHKNLSDSIFYKLYASLILFFIREIDGVGVLFVVLDG